MNRLVPRPDEWAAVVAVCATAGRVLVRLGLPVGGESGLGVAAPDGGRVGEGGWGRLSAGSAAYS